MAITAAGVFAASTSFTPAAFAQQGQPAQPTSDQLDAAARILFESARDAFNRGDYEVALARFRQAYEASPRPALLFNIGTTLDRLRRDAEALETFRRYLEEDPGALNRGEIEARIRLLDSAVTQARQQEAERQQQLEAQQRQEQQSPTPLPDSPATRSEPRDQGEAGGGLPPVVFIASAGATVVAGALTVIFGLGAVSKNDDYEAHATMPGATFESARALYDDARSAQTMTNVFIGVTGGLAALSVVTLLLTDWGGDDAETRAEAGVGAVPVVAIGEGGAVVGASIHF